jgi:hypothetical protein
MDGQCVRRWTQRTLATSRARLLVWLDQGNRFQQADGSLLPKELGRLQSLEVIIGKCVVCVGVGVGGGGLGPLGHAPPITR